MYGCMLLFVLLILLLFLLLLLLSLYHSIHPSHIPYTLLIYHIPCIGMCHVPACTLCAGNSRFTNRYQDFRSCSFENVCLADKEVVVQYALQNNSQSTRSGVLDSNKSYRKKGWKNSHVRNLPKPIIVNMTCVTGTTVLLRNDLRHIDW